MPWMDTLQVVPADPVAQYGAALAYLAQGRDSLALQRLREVIAADSADLLCYAHLAEAARRTGALPRIASELKDSVWTGSFRRGPLEVGMVLLELAAWDSAEACGRAALSAGYKVGEAHLLRARALRGKGLLDEAMQEAITAASLAAHADDTELLVRSLDARCITHRARGELSHAGEAGNEALRLCLRYGLRHLEAPIRCELGYLQLLRGDPVSAERMLHEALAVAECAGDRRCRGWVLKMLGDALFEQGDLAASETMVRKALEALRAVRDPEGPAACLDALAGIAGQRGQMTDAAALYEEAIVLHRARSDHRAESATMVNLGSTALDHGEVSHAVTSFHSALRVAAGRGDSATVAAASIGLSNAYLALGDLKRAGEFLHRALALAQITQDTATIALAQGALGSLEFRRGSLAKARDHFIIAMRFFDLLGDRRSMAAALMNAGMVMLKDDPLAAELALREAVDISTESRYPYEHASACAALGEVALREGRLGRAESLFVGCLAQSLVLRAPDITWFAQYGLARCHEAAQEWDASLSTYEAAITTIDNSRAQLPVHEWRFGFLATTLEIHDHFIRFLAALDERRPAEGFARRAFEVAEAAKARSFLDLLDESERRRLGVGASPSEACAPLVREISRLSKMLWQLPEDSPRADLLRRKLAAREDELNRVRLSSDPSGLAVTAAANMPLAALQVLMRSAGVDLLLEYHTGNAGSFVWAIRSDTLMMRALPSRSRLAELAAPIHYAASHSPRVGVDDEIWRHRLAEAILPPREWLQVAPGRICIVPDGPLFYVPFETLPISVDSGGSEVLIEIASVSYAPSTAVLLALWRQDGSCERDAILAIGIKDPRGIETATSLEWAWVDREQAIEYGKNSGFRGLSPLYYAEAEAESVCASFGTSLCTTLLGADARETRVKDELQHPYAIAHLATHSLIDVRAPRRSCIVLNPEPDGPDDGVLVFDEILGLASAPDLIVLSSCESAMGQLITGEGMVGLSRAFFHAGARAVLVSLWSVNDRSTAIWMREFYGQLALGMPVDGALRAAKLRFLHGAIPALRHPYYWAPFVLVGRV